MDNLQGLLFWKCWQAEMMLQGGFFTSRKTVETIHGALENLIIDADLGREYEEYRHAAYATLKESIERELP